MKLTNKLIAAGEDAKVVHGTITGGYTQATEAGNTMTVVTLADMDGKGGAAGVIVSPSVARVLGPNAHQGDTLALTFLGARKLSGGRSIKEFDIDLTPAAPDKRGPALASFWTAPAAPVGHDADTAQ